MCSRRDPGRECVRFVTQTTPQVGKDNNARGRESQHHNRAGQSRKWNATKYKITYVFNFEHFTIPLNGTIRTYFGYEQPFAKQTSHTYNSNVLLMSHFRWLLTTFASLASGYRLARWDEAAFGSLDVYTETYQHKETVVRSGICCGHSVVLLYV
jgi:hypothetical protein